MNFLLFRENRLRGAFFSVQRLAFGDINLLDFVYDIVFGGGCYVCCIVETKENIKLLTDWRYISKVCTVYVTTINCCKEQHKTNNEFSNFEFHIFLVSNLGFSICSLNKINK